MKMHKRYPRSSDLRFSNDPQRCPLIPQKVLKSLEVLRGPQKVFKATSIPQKVISVIKILWSSKAPQMFIKWSSKSPQKFLNNSPQMVHKKSAKVPERVLQRSERYSGPQVFKKSSKRPQSPQKVRKMHKKVPNVLRPQVLKRYSKSSTMSSKGYQRSIPQ